MHFACVASSLWIWNWLILLGSRYYPTFPYKLTLLYLEEDHNNNAYSSYPTCLVSFQTYWGKIFWYPPIRIILSILWNFFDHYDITIILSGMQNPVYVCYVALILLKLNSRTFQTLKTLNWNPIIIWQYLEEFNFHNICICTVYKNKKNLWHYYASLSYKILMWNDTKTKEIIKINPIYDNAIPLGTMLLRIQKWKHGDNTLWLRL